MKLFCWHCNDNHEFTIPNVERIVYTQIGMLTDLAAIQDDVSDKYPPCLLDIIDMSCDADDYYEFTEQNIERRKAKAAKP